MAACCTEQVMPAHPQQRCDYMHAHVHAHDHLHAHVHPHAHAHTCDMCMCMYAHVHAHAHECMCMQVVMGVSHGGSPGCWSTHAPHPPAACSGRGAAPGTRRDTRDGARHERWCARGGGGARRDAGGRGYGSAWPRAVCAGHAGRRGCEAPGGDTQRDGVGGVISSGASRWAAWVRALSPCLA